ncbi:TonB-dependent siderophore receptor [Methylotenera sp.]|uniref:TonB-dependent receptor n=1 Tax=Methylotenera sp. TaxID=2051956 RepID=UPI002489E747|nr:TonB-dependent receptor [Methylotenera sp.]MDI1363226.1 TonB-dependent receptor [Methylotenera sp.]
MKSRKMPRLALNVVAIAIASAYPLVSMAEDTANKEKAVPTTVNKAENAPAELSEVKVNATNTESKADGYQATKTRVGKVLQDPHDIPQAITTVTHSLMQDQQVSSLREALRNVSGLTFNAAEGGRGGDNFNLRGFYTFGDIYLDGVRDTAQYYRETFNLEQVDVLRGSAAMLFGRGQAGGVINQVTKMAELADKNTVTGSFGEYNYHQFTGDFNKKLGDTTAIRVNVMDRSEETYRENPATGDRPESDRQGIALSVGTGIGTNNEFFLNHVYTKTRDVPDYGIRFVSTRPINNSIGNDSTFWGTARNFDDSETSITTGIFTHKFTEDTQLRTQIRHADYDRAYWAQTSGALAPTATGTGVINFATNPDTVTLSNGNTTRSTQYTTDTIQSDFSTKFDLAGMKNQFLAGLEYLKEDSERHSLQGFNATTGLSYGNLNNTNANNNALSSAIAVNGVFYDRNSYSSAAASKFQADNYAAYVQDTIEFVRNWDLLLGVRRDEMRAEYSSATSPKLSYGENSYRAGLSWHQTPENHYYLSYSDSFSPTADLYQLTVVPQPPERSKTVELGAKWLFLDGDLSFRTALYRTTKDWERSTDLEATASILTKKRRTDGLEFEVTGNITDNWEIFSGLAFMDAKILEVAENVNATTGVITPAYSGYKGQRARNTAPVTFNMWTTYKFLGNWKVGGGFEAKDERYGYNPSGGAGANFVNGEFKPNIAPGYTRWDAMLAYEAQKWAVRLNVKNLFDKTYYGDVYDNGGFTVPGNRRQAIITTEYKF